MASAAAAAAGATQLGDDWQAASLPCTKAGAAGAPRVLDLTNIVRDNGGNLSRKSAPECADILEPVVRSRAPGAPSMAYAVHDTAMTEMSTAGSVAAKRTAGARVIALWVLEALRGHLYVKGNKVYLPAKPAPAAAQTPTGAAAAGAAATGDAAATTAAAAATAAAEPAATEAATAPAPTAATPAPGAAAAAAAASGGTASGGAEVLKVVPPTPA